MLSRTRSPTQTALFCWYFGQLIFFVVNAAANIKDVRNSLLIAHNNSLLSDEDLLLLLLSSENPQFNYEKYERFDIDDI